MQGEYPTQKHDRRARGAGLRKYMTSGWLSEVPGTRTGQGTQECIFRIFGYFGLIESSSVASAWRMPSKQQPAPKCIATLGALLHAVWRSLPQRRRTPLHKR